MNEKQLKTISKFLSLTLRHQPQLIGLQLNQEGWADVNELIQKGSQHHPELTKAVLDLVVSTNDKKRFAYNEDESKIRASQGHSIDIELNIEPKQPPEYLHHGTVDKFMEAIKKEGLQKMKRNHVHLSATTDTAITVGNRRGEAIILTVFSGRMHEEGYLFYLSANGVWLTEAVPVEFINF
jgi:putative RNA 2'-phosphotransferase